MSYCMNCRETGMELDTNRLCTCMKIAESAPRKPVLQTGEYKMAEKMNQNPPYTPGPRQAVASIPKPNWNASKSDVEDEDILQVPQHQDPNEEDRRKHTTLPSHYTRFKIEPVTFIMQNQLTFEIGSIVKYACRAGHKLYAGMDETQSAITDLEKVRRFAEMRINQLQGKETL